MDALIKFEKLYSVYRDFVNILCDNTVSFYENIALTGRSNKKLEFLIQTFGLYFPIKRIEGNPFVVKDKITSNSHVNLEGVLHIVFKQDPGIGNWQFPIPACLGKDGTKITVYGIECNLHHFSKVDDLLDAMIDMEEILFNLMMPNIDDFVKDIQKNANLYPAYEINSNQFKIYRRIQFINTDNKISHYTAIKRETVRSKEFVQQQYDDLIKAIHLLVDGNIIDYLYLDGAEQDIYNIFTEKPTGYSSETDKEIWNGSQYNSESMMKSIENGMYLPFLYDINNGKIILKEGIHRFQTLFKMRNNGIVHPSLAMNMSDNVRQIDSPVTVYLLKDLYDGCKRYLNIITAARLDLNGLPYYKLQLKDSYSLIAYYTIIYRDLNNMIDSGLFKKYGIEPSKIINKWKEELK